MTAKDYLDRIRKASSLERLSDLSRQMEGDEHLSEREVTALMATINQRTLYLARIASTP
jgi:hypothetical protein